MPGATAGLKISLGRICFMPLKINSGYGYLVDGRSESGAVDNRMS